MRTQRMQGKWVRFDGAHLPVPTPSAFSAEDIEALVSIYSEEVAAMGVGSDVLAYEDDIKQLIAKEFVDRRGRVVAADDLVAKLTALRKRGLRPKVAVLPEISSKDMGFEDINEAK
jgi:hypothetical protein